MRFDLLDAGCLPVKLDAFWAGTVGLNPFGVILLDAGNDQTVAKALVVGSGVGAKLPDGHDLTAQGTLVFALLQGATFVSTQ
jgi:hypothetical protein